MHVVRQHQHHPKLFPNHHLVHRVTVPIAGGGAIHSKAGLRPCAAATRGANSAAGSVAVLAILRHTVVIALVAETVVRGQRL